VHWNPLFKTWIVTRHSDVAWVVRNHELFSSAVSSGDPSDVYPPIDEADWELVRRLKPARSLIISDRPDHLAMRQTIHRWFTPKASEKWRSQLAMRAQELIDARRADGTMELKEDLATPLPLLTICWMLGVPREDAAHLHELTNVTQTVDFAPDRLRAAYDAFVELSEYFTPLIEARAKQPREDLISMLADGERRGVFTREECLASILLLLVAGHETTLTLISKGTLAFIRNPEQWDLFRGDPEGLAVSATEECLRYDPPVNIIIRQRVAAQDVELGGKLIRSGDEVAYAIASANRDPRVFADPDTFDITRSPNPHLAFGGGIHHCIGAALGRIEGQEAFKALARNFTRLRLEREVEYTPVLGLHTVSELPVSWD
jgi:cytochrome P450